jgi:hypothetical protein
LGCCRSEIEIKWRIEKTNSKFELITTPQSPPSEGGDKGEAKNIPDKRDFWRNTIMRQNGT